MIRARTMRNRIRATIAEKIFQVFKQDDVYFELEVAAKKLQCGKPTLQWSLPASKEEVIKNNFENLKFEENIVKNVKLRPTNKNELLKVEFELEPQSYLESLLVPQKYKTILSEKELKPQHTVVEFSSPNIAKPFHVGHIRSTIIGNVLANIHSRIGHKVTKMNYLGDWGTQFGMLQVGVEMISVTEEKMQAKPIETLYEAYVAANTAAKTDPQISEKARRYFSKLEAEKNVNLVKQWQKYRDYTKAELERIYARLGVSFDEYEWESEYSQKEISVVLADLKKKGLLLDENDGRKVVEVDGRRIPIIKSDGTTLYLARDIAALVDRFQRMKFSRILYVCENGQADHFNALFKTTAALSNYIKLEQLKHVKFGRIHGMSTRSGNVVFLRDVLDEARDIMVEKQLKSSTTKIDLTNEAFNSKNVADVLGVSAVIVNDLKQRRQRDYNFDWNKALQVNGDTGIKLQYTHCRLFSLMENVAHINVTKFKPSLEHLLETEAQDLLYELSRYEQILWLTKVQLEACILVNYLFSLCNITSRALKRLNVIHEADLGKQKCRILLFSAAKSTLKEGMELLGLKPLNQM